MAYGNSTALTPVTSPAKPVVNPISGLLSGLGSNWWILIVLYLVFFKKGSLGGISGKGVLGGLSGLGDLMNNWWIWLILILLIQQPSADSPDGVAASGGLGSLINGIGGMDGIIKNLGGIDGIVGSLGGVDGIIKSLGGIEGIMGMLNGVNGLLANKAAL